MFVCDNAVLVPAKKEHLSFPRADSNFAKRDSLVSERAHVRSVFGTIGCWRGFRERTELGSCGLRLGLLRGFYYSYYSAVRVRAILDLKDESQF